MKNLMKYFGVIVLCFTLILSSSNSIEAARAEGELDTIENNSIKFLAYEYPFDIKQQWVEFKFVNQGNNIVKLKCYMNGKFINSSELKSNLALYNDLAIGLTNIYGLDGFRKFDRATSMRSFGQYLESLTFTYNVDTIQIVRNPYMIPDFSTDGSPVYTYHGKIHSNLQNQDFNMTFWSPENTSDWRFRIRKNGLYAEYIKQDKIPDGEYIIETAEYSNRVFDLLSGNNIGVSNYMPNTTSQIFNVQYNDLYKAYMIKPKNSNKVLHWDKSNGNNVIAGDNLTYSDDLAGERLWYLHNTGNGTYRISSARKQSNVLNVDANYSNISVTNNKNNKKQEFKFVKVDEKVSLLDGQWRIVSKINNNKSLNVHIGGSDPNNVTIWDNADVSQQKWTFEYDSSKKAYLIKNNYTNLYLSWTPNGSTTNVRTSGRYQNGAYWVLEYVGDGYYIFKNYHNQNMVLDLTQSNTGNGSNIIVFKNNGGNNQKFKIVR